MGLFPKATYPYDLGLPVGPNSNCYFVDPTNGSDSYKGTCPEKPLATVAEAEDRCVTNQNDVVVLIGGPTANYLTESLVWDKSYTHLVGLSGDLPGVGQRPRVTSATDAAITVMVALQGSACIFKNLNIQNECVAAADSGALLVSGMRNYFKNCFISGILDRDVVGIRAAAYSCTVTGPENFFDQCAIGVSTIERTAANAELILSGSNCKRNHFRKCQFLSQSVTAGKVLVRVAAATELWQLNFEECVFSNLAMNNGAGAGGTKIDHALEDGATMYHQIQLWGLNTAYGCTQFTDVATYVFTHGAAVGGAVAPIALNNLTT
ncbi:MAG: hypothetical protein PHV11_08775 [Candidatus Bipolaricaulis sp.]|nr:hypothetical protein [Candidatus Bipolaricaulis sp.]